MNHIHRAPRRFIGLSAALVLLWYIPGTNAPDPGVTFAQSLAPHPCPIDMRLLVITADGSETVLPAIQQTLDYLGTPYTLYTARATPGGLTASTLSQGCRAFYHGVILATSELGYFNSAGMWTSALTAVEWAALRQYEADFGIRQVTWYTFPLPTYGFQPGSPVDTTTTPIAASFTPEGAAVFSYLNTSNPLTIRNVYAFVALPLDGNTTPLLVDSNGRALAAVYTAPDGRQNLGLTFDGNQHLLHSVVLGYGLINWVTRGLFLGERHIYMSPQVDDLLIHNDQWDVSTPCGTPFESTGYQHRATASDLQAVLNWQAKIRTRSTTQAARLSIAFNGVGSTGIYDPDDLTPFVKRARVKREFYWINHTYTHENLDNADYSTARDEIDNNIQTARTLGLPNFDKVNLVTPNISGLTNPSALQAAFDLGIRYLVTDTSQPGYSNPTPNTGIFNQYQPKILMIPRRPNNLFYNVAAPDDWAAEYNCIYQAFWQAYGDPDGLKSYQEILDLESQNLLGYLLKGDADPWMFHQPNLDAYDGTRTLLTDLLNVTLAKYNSIYTLPIASPPMQQVGELMKARMTYNASGVNATLYPEGLIKLTVSKNATVPITGLKTAAAELYGGQYISRIDVTRWRPITVAVQ